MSAASSGRTHAYARMSYHAYARMSKSHHLTTAVLARVRSPTDRTQHDETTITLTLSL